MSKSTINIEYLNNSQSAVLRKVQEKIDPDKMIRNLISILDNKYKEKIKEIKFNGRTLNSNDSFKSCDIKDGCTLTVICEIDNIIINLYVEIASRNGHREPYKVSVDQSIKTEQLIEKIKEKVPFSVDASYLACGARSLMNGKTLLSQNIKNNDTVQVLTRAVGG